MKNKDDQCFKWAATRALHPVEDHAYRVTELLKEQSEGYNWNESPSPPRSRISTSGRLTTTPTLTCSDTMTTTKRCTPSE